VKTREVRRPAKVITLSGRGGRHGQRTFSVVVAISPSAAGAVRRVEILRGSQSSIFGTNAVAGVVSITTVATEDAPEGTTQTLALEAGSYATASASYGLTQRQGPLTLSFGLTHSRTDGFSAAEDDAGNTETDPSDATLLSLGAIYEVTPELTIGANAFLETTNSEFDEFVGIAPGDGTPGDETASTHTMGFRIFAEYEGLTWSHRLSATHLAVERELASATVASPFASPYASSFDGTTTGLQYLATTEALTNTVLSFGADWQEDEGSFTGLSGGTRTLSTAGVFGEAVWTAMPGLDILLSARHEDNESFGGVTTGRLAASYQLDGATTLRGAIATGYRAPVLSELYGTFPLSGGQFFFGNPNLQPGGKRQLRDRHRPRLFRRCGSVGDTLPARGGQLHPVPGLHPRRVLRLHHERHQRQRPRRLHLPGRGAVWSDAALGRRDAHRGLYLHRRETAKRRPRDPRSAP
jgi:outer membrane cobalamin receptor